MDKGSYALFIMLLFRPQRFGASLDYLEPVLHTQHARSLPEDAVWLLVYGEYLRWRKDDIDAVAAPFLEKSTSPSPVMPRFDTTEWWACMISLRLRNIDLVLSNHLMNPYSEPTDIASLPVASATHDIHGNEDRNASDGEKSDRSRSRLPSDPGSDVGKDRDDDFPNTSHGLGAKGKSPYPPTVLQRCGEFPDNSSIGDFMQFQLHGSGRSIERKYEILYAEASQKVFGKSDGNNASVLAHVEDNAACVSPAEAVALFKQQSLFFKELDAYNVDASENPAKLHATVNSPMQHWQSGLADTIRSLGNVIPSHPRLQAT